MMKMPNADRAFVDIAKLRDYCLSANHPRGRHKARVFVAALGLTEGDAAELQHALLEAAQIEEVVSGEQDSYGQRYVLDFPLSTAAGRAVVRSSWIVRQGEDFPRLTSCYVLS